MEIFKRAEGYVKDSINNKINISNKIPDCQTLNLNPVPFSSKANNNLTSTLQVV